jgi:hypothetical protein
MSLRALEPFLALFLTIFVPLSAFAIFPTEIGFDVLLFAGPDLNRAILTFFF